MIRKVITYPDKILREVSKPVENFDKDLHELLDDMYETMIAYEGIGLAAIQVAVPLNALLINLVDEDGVQDKENLKEVINPKILEKDGKTVYKEGCLSVPEFYEDIERASHIKVRYQNRLGEYIEEELEGLLAIAMQHEMDHLKGTLFIEKLSYLKRKKFEKEFKKRKRNRI
ncbi:MAG: peptide deformylase [Sulfurospirillaceae bacterium]|jgi:peptide deformylase|nr:peptide deformylase [Sulfurospirillaceae bacterium]MCK9545099.1 peptide deformylase [Sulfurospirillaceae bacterium]MDY0238284.1 peptide deformylase [Campylobacterales bacterium]NLM99909.1 peptide deformylase [Campylobacteraceae bacterium]